LVAVQVFGNDHAVAFAGWQGNFQLNAYKPVILYNVLESIQLLEPPRRGPYGGGGRGRRRRHRPAGAPSYVQAGAGIVADSAPASEREETLNKARGLLRPLEMAEKQL
jgi:hypothetical protein